MAGSGDQMYVISSSLNLAIKKGLSVLVEETGLLKFALANNGVHTCAYLEQKMWSLGVWDWTTEVNNNIEM